MSVETRVAQHYRHGALERAILDGLAAMGKNKDRLALEDLAPVDEFHIGGRQATIEFAAQLDLRPGLNLLDIGSGLGGAARYFAHAHGCRVTGIDLTAEYVEVARALALRVGLSERVDYLCGSALAMPFVQGSFDGAYMLHVGMNIENKAALFGHVFQLLKPGGFFGIYDVMRTGKGDIAYPAPWAATAETSFVATPQTYRRLLEQAGFSVTKQRGRRDFAIEFFRQMRARAAESGGPPPVGLHILMGPEFPRKTANMIANLENDLIAPTELICRKPP